MSAEKRWRLVAYDVRDPKRYRKVFKILRGAGRSVQYSLFRCHLDAREVEQLRLKLAQVMDQTDRLLVVDLCPTCASNVVARNHVDGWGPQEPTFRVFAAGGAPDIQVPPSAAPRSKPKG
jgi:CRISPR-associated protein Cas2